MEGLRAACSQLTLQSDKRGFFRELADHVASLCPEHFSSDFASLTSDQERLLLCRSTPQVWNSLRERLSHVEEVLRSKSGWLAELRLEEGKQVLEGLRREGNKLKEAVVETRCKRALGLLNQAVARAEGGSQVLAEAYITRARLLMVKKDWQLALSDFRISLSQPYTKVPKKDIYLLMAECYMRLGESKKGQLSLDIACKMAPDDFDTKEKCKAISSLTMCVKLSSEQVPEKIDLADGRNEQYPGLSGVLRVESTPTTGRYLVTDKALRVGSVVAYESPAAATLLTDFHGTHCIHCFTRLVTCVPCPKCSGVVFCSVKCCQEATYHQFECRHLELMIGSGMSVICFLSLRIITQNSLNYFKDIYPKLLDKNVRHPFAKLYHLEGHQEKRDWRSIFDRTLMAFFLLEIIRQTDYLPLNEHKDMLSEDELLIAELMLHMLLVLQYNCHEIYETLTKGGSITKTKTKYIGIAVYPSASLFNHNCNNTLARYFIGKDIVLRSTRPLEAGEEVTENYGPVYTMRTFSQRQDSLQARYLFNCQCEACKEDWPQLSIMTDFKPIYLRCKIKGCKGSVIVDESRDMQKCKTCGRVQDMKDELVLYKKAIRNYENAVALLDLGKSAEAESITKEMIEFVWIVGKHPGRVIALAQEVLRSCWSSKYNTYHM